MSRRWAIFTITTANFFLSQFYRASNAVIAPQLMNDLALDTQSLGLLSAFFFYAFAITQVPITLLLDRIGARRMMAGLSMVGICGALLFAEADSFAGGALGRALLGVGMACNLMGTLKLLTVWFDARLFATLSGVVFSIGTIGNIAATSPLVMLVELTGWRGAFRAIAALNVLLIAALWIVVRDRPRQGKIKEDPALCEQNLFSGLRLLLNSRDFWIIACTAGVNYGIFAALQTLWAGPYLIEVHEFSALAAGNLILLMSVGTVLGSPFWGALSDRFFPKRKVLVCLGQVLFGASLVLTALLPRPSGPAVLACLFLGFGLFRSTGMLVYTHIKELMPLQMAGAAMTGVNSINMVGPAVFLHGLGTLMQHLYPHDSRGPEAFTAAFLVCAGGLFLLVLAYLFTRERN